jgi:NTE family protein
MSTISVGSDRSPAERIARDAGPVDRRRRPSPRVVLGIASLGSAVAFVDATVVNIAFPNIAHSFPDTSIASPSWARFRATR